jgi:hypothetical protein
MPSRPWTRDEVTPEYLATRIELRSGVMHWLPRGEAWFDANIAGQPVTLRRDSKGYYRIRVCKVELMAHRVIWALHHGAWPNEYLDHINRDKTDNRIDNLRDVPMFVNNLNTDRPRFGGGMGVHLSKRYGTWVAQIRVRGRCHHLGSFGSRAAARDARRAAEIRFFGQCFEEVAATRRNSGGTELQRRAAANEQRHIAHDKRADTL